MHSRSLQSAGGLVASQVGDIDAQAKVDGNDERRKHRSSAGGAFWRCRPTPWHEARELPSSWPREHRVQSIAAARRQRCVRSGCAKRVNGEGAPKFFFFRAAPREDIAASCVGRPLLAVVSILLLLLLHLPDHKDFAHELELRVTLATTQQRARSLGDWLQCLNSF